MKTLRSRTGKTKTTTDAGPEVEHDEVARLAYSYWEARGGAGGSAEEDWVRAERELRNRRTPAPAAKASAAG
jgi:hypothetical protein